MSAFPSAGDPARRSASIQAALLTACLASGAAALISMASLPQAVPAQGRARGIVIELAAARIPAPAPSVPDEDGLPRARERHEAPPRILASELSPEKPIAAEAPRERHRPVAEDGQKPGARRKPEARKNPEARKKPEAKRPPAIKPGPTSKKLPDKPGPRPEKSLDAPVRNESLEAQRGAEKDLAGAQDPNAASADLKAADGASCTGAAEASAKELLVQALVSRIEARRRYPLAARRAGAEGTVELRFSIDADGRIARASVASASGHRSLDIAASRIADELAGTPLGIRGEALVVTVPVRYSLR